jgi:hypothetical protein
MNKKFVWQKLGHVFNTKTLEKKPTWLHEYGQAPNAILFDDFVRVYFSCRPARDENGNFVSYSAFVDIERRDLTKVIRLSDSPILPLGKKGCFDEFGTYPFSAIRIGDEVLGYYGGWTRCSSVPFDVSIGVCKSSDNGESFSRLGDGPILTSSLYEPFTISSPKIRYFNKQFYLYYCSGTNWNIINGKPEMALRIRMATSKDGLTWFKYNKSLISAENPFESQASPDVLYFDGKYHMFFDYWDSKSFRNSKTRKIGYATSEDLENWERDDNCVGITPTHNPGDFDSEMVAYPHVLIIDERLFFSILAMRLVDMDSELLS